MSKPSIFAKLEKKITASDSGGVMERWHFGQEVLKSKTGRRQLPDGMIADLVKAAGLRKNGKPKLSEREIQRRVRFAEVYATDQQVRQILADLGSWSEIIAANFPEVTVDEDLAEPEDLELPAADGWDQLTLLPGFKETVRVHRRDVPLAELTVPESIAYRDKYRSMHEGFGKTLDLIERTVDAIIDGWDGDPETKAVDAYKRAIDEDGAES